jgi:quercetin dioxygenase-like cupin family protein
MSDSATPTFIPNLMQQGRDLLAAEGSGLQSTVVHAADGQKAQLFAFHDGDALPEHAVSRHAVLHFLKGTATVQLGDEEKTARSQTWIYIPPELPHSITAHAPTLMLLQVASTSA